MVNLGWTQMQENNKRSETRGALGNYSNQTQHGKMGNKAKK